MSSLRGAETDWSESVCGRCIDHSVIIYWETHLPPRLVEDAVRIIGSELDNIVGYTFSVMDDTSFSNWHNELAGFHLLTRIAEGTVYPVSMTFDILDPVPNTRNALVPGHGFLLCDKWYDVNRVFRLIYQHGYIPLISPQRNRDSGHWRKKGRKVYRKERFAYRQRGREESLFGSLTNAYGDRLNTRLLESTYIRSVAMVIAYQIKICIRSRLAGCYIILENN